MEKTATDLALSHYSAFPLVLDDRSYVQERRGVYGKPRGFWVSCDGEYDWAEWCRDEEFNVSSLHIQTKIRIKPDANILILSNKEELDDFTVKYGTPSQYRDYAIDWKRVSEEYDGIIITPYVWAARLEPKTSWYYGWDCASGCIWNTSVLEIVHGE